MKVRKANANLVQEKTDFIYIHMGAIEERNIATYLQLMVQLQEIQEWMESIVQGASRRRRVWMPDMGKERMAKTFILLADEERQEYVKSKVVEMSLELFENEIRSGLPHNPSYRRHMQRMRHLMCVQKELRLRAKKIRGVQQKKEHPKAGVGKRSKTKMSEGTNTKA